MQKLILIVTLFTAACSFNGQGVISDDTAADAGADVDGSVKPDCGSPDAADGTQTVDAASDAGTPDASPPDAPAPVPTITCKVVSSGIEYAISGGVRDHLYPDGGTVATPTYLEYGDGFDGWVLPYPSGSTKQKIAYAGDLDTYTFTLDAAVTDLNFFLTDPSDTDGSDGAVGGKYFRLAEWSFVNVTNANGIAPNCRLDAGGGGILH
jgi:hypothetical protein